MTLSKLILKLQAFEKVVGDLPIYNVYLENQPNGESKMMIKEDIVVGLGYDDINEKVKCLFLGEQITFTLLEPGKGNESN